MLFLHPSRQTKLRHWASLLVLLSFGCAEAVFTVDAGLDGGGGVMATGVDLGMPMNPVCGEERCTGMDDDCDGRTDEGFNLGQTCEARSGSCVLVGEYACGLAGEGICQPLEGQSNGQVELCNEADDDCDGIIDEGLPENCDECTPMDEVCNGMDDDCDQSIDEEVANACGECGPVPEEECNDVDDDCDGVTDEGVQNACGGCGPGEMETCNAVDDDCDGLIDEESDCGCPITRIEEHPYLICSQEVNWNSARQQCQGRGYDMVVLKDAEEDAAVFAAVRAAGLGDTWIGLTDRDEENVWLWVDGSILDRNNDYQNWARGEPNNSDNEDCILYIVGSDRNSDWDDRPCGRNYGFVCEAPR